MNFFPGKIFEKVNGLLLKTEQKRNDMSDRIKSENPIYDELLLAQEELEEIRGMPIINVGEVVWRQKCQDWEGAWVLVLHKEDMWTSAPEKSEDFVDQPGFYAYDVLCPDGRIMRYTDAVLRKHRFSS